MSKRVPRKSREGLSAVQSGTRNRRRIAVLIYSMTNAVIFGAGIITVDSNPPGAMVFLDGSPQKSTPVRIRGLRPETTHTITVKKDGYKDWATSFTVGTGSKSFMANLKKM